MFLSLFVLYLIKYSTVQGGKGKHTIGTFNWKIPVPCILEISPFTCSLQLHLICVQGKINCVYLNVELWVCGRPLSLFFF